MNKWFSSSVLKHLFFYTGIFSVSVSVLCLFLYYSTLTFVTEQVDSVVAAEIKGLEEQYNKSGLSELAAIINKRLQNSPASPSIYLLAAPGYQPISGNLNSWPDFTRLSDGWIRFEVLDHQQKQHPVRAKTFTLYGGYHLIVGQNISTLTRLQTLLRDTLLWFMVLTLSLGVIGGYFLSRNMLGKLTRINQSCENIISGDLTQRIPQDQSNDEFDQLSGTMNKMLDSNYQLMQDVKRVSDNIAHDLKTPLSRLKNSLEDALMESSAQDIRHRIETSIDETDTLLGMFNALLKIVSIETSQTINFSCQNLNLLVTDVHELYHPIAESKNIQLNLIQTEAELKVKTNPDLLFQALANVVDNGIKYTPEGGQVTLEVKQNEQGVHIIVKDTGIGVPSDELAKITTRFYRTDLSRQLPGTGLGLSLVSAICQALSMKLQLKNLSKGLCVQFTLEKESLSQQREHHAGKN